MREESHLDDMRAAIRGDFERLQERRGEQELMRVSENGEELPAAEALPPEPEPVFEPEHETAPEPEPEPEPGLEPELDDELDSSQDDSPSTAPAAEPEPAADDAQRAFEPEEAPRRSWVDRLLGR